MEDSLKGKPSTYPSGYSTPGTCNLGLLQNCFIHWGLVPLVKIMRCQKKPPYGIYAKKVALHTSHKINFLGFSTRKTCTSRHTAAFVS